MVRNRQAKHEVKTELESLARQLFTKHNLVGWTFGYDNAKRRLGVCKHRTKQIGMSNNYIEILPKEKLIDTLLHEMAHAIVGKNHGHDYVWRQKAIELGCDGQRCYSGEEKVVGKYTVTCPNCGNSHPRHKKTARSGQTACAKCCNEHNGGKYSSEYVFEWKQNY